LNSRANRLAHYLQGLGVGPESIVGLLLSRTAEMVVSVLGVLKAGGAYLPLDEGSPEQRLGYMLGDAGAEVVITERRLMERVCGRGIKLVVVDVGEQRQEIGAHSGEEVESKAGADNLAYVIYTSGSTGAAKGVLGLHRGAVNRFNWMWKTFPFEAGEVCCQKTSLSFLDSLWEIFGPLLQGIPVCIIPDDVVKEPSRLIQTLATQKVTRIVLVPSLLRVMMDTYDDLQSRLPELKYWVTSGEALPSELARRFQESMPQHKLINLYGLSESSADSTFYEVNGRIALQSIPIGRPIDNTQTYLLDTNLWPVPLATNGELYIGGDGLARGYLNRPELTAEKFTPNPFSEKAGSRLYRTGDLARYLPDGTIEYAGRVDHQVKVRGNRVELGEIEAALRQYPIVQQAVVLARDDERGGQCLVAYLVPYPGQLPTARELQVFLKSKLPTYMLPSAFMLLESLPLTSSGKIDRRALLTSTQVRAVLEVAFVAPRTPIEKLLAGMWAEIICLEQVGINDNFFELGGHSLLAIQLLTDIRNTLRVELPMEVFLERPTVAELAAAIEETLIGKLENLTDEEAQRYLENEL
jgi:amino acid adenylation domain-containing protein